jgi:hypothetical protein
MRYLWVSLLVWAGVLGWTQQQNIQTAPRHAEHFLDYLADTLRLRPDQREKVQALLEQHLRRAQEIRQSMPTGSERRKALGALRRETDQGISVGLDPNQQSIWEAIKADWRRRAKARYEKRTGKRLPPEAEE